MSVHTLIKRFEQALLKSWRHPNLFTLALLPLSGLYLTLATLNRCWYSIGLGVRYESPIPTIVVGNLTVGGSGKSPFVAALVQALQNQDLRVGIVSRGYKRTANASVLVIEPSSDAKTVGDEPLMLFLQTKAPTAVASDRRSAIRKLVAMHELDVIVCDDGLQHWKLKPTITICIDDQSVKASNHWILPAGPYRELRGRLAKMDEVVVHIKQPSKELLKTSNQVKSLRLKRCLFWLEVQSAKPVAISAKQGSLASLKVNLVAGIAKPQRFFETAQTLGYSGQQHSFSDHHQFTREDLIFDNNLPVLMTEKDAVKCREFEFKNLWYLPVSACLDQDMICRIVKRLGVD